MSFMERYKYEFKKQIQHYSQEEGLKDHEIAELLGCSRATINRTRKAENIPTVNLSKRLDKKCVCHYCKKSYLIRRCERNTARCPECTTNQEKTLQKSV